MGQRLIQGMYGSEFAPASNLFGLYCGQIRIEDLVHNGGWYNKQGEKLGWGDLDKADFLRIATELKDGELFIVLSESDSFWNFVTKIGPLGSLCKTDPKIENPGKGFVAQKCNFIIGPCQLYYVDEYNSLKDSAVDIKGLEFEVLTREKAKQLINSL